MRKRIGLMGCGSVADYGHLPAILNIPELELVALFDPVPDRAATFASRFGNPSAHESLQSFFETPMDAVAITSPAPTHRDNVLACALHGLDVLCEKPIAMDDNEAEEMIAAMEKADKLFAIGFCYRFSPVALQIHRWIREGVIGQVRSLRLLYVWNLHGRYVKLANGTWEESPVWRGRMVEGGPMVDCGVHQIDLARWWLGSEVATHHGFGAWVADYEAPDHQYLHLTHENGIHTMAEVSFSYNHTSKEPRDEFSYHLIGDGGVIRYDRSGWILEARNGQGTTLAQGASEKNFAGMYSHFAQCLMTRQMGHMPTARDGLIATQIARSATEQAISLRLRKD